jgi:3'-5' exoribonuclease
MAIAVEGPTVAGSTKFAYSGWVVGPNALYRKAIAMTRQYLKELSSGQIVDDEIYMLTQKDLRTAANGSLYIHAVLADRTGQMPARMWQASQELYILLPQSGFVRVRGRTESYKGALQFIIEGIQPVETDEVDMDEFLRKTEKDVDKMSKRLLEILRQIKDRDLLFLIKQFVEDRDLMDRYKRAPAAVQMHHAYLGGLLEHTLNVLELVALIAKRYPQIRMGAMMVEAKAKRAEAELGHPFPEPLLRVLQHMILSHHGDYQFGSPRLPMTAEAIALHHLDNLDAKLAMVQQQIEESDQTDPDSHWTSYVKALERRLFKGDVFEPTPEAQP